MDNSFDFSRLLKNHKKHISKPEQFLSVAGGVQKRIESNIRNRKSNRLTVFDNLRNLTSVMSPPQANKSEAKSKVEHRRLQLEKWKEEKEKKKTVVEIHKKKPFVAGVARAPLKFVPPPPPPKTKPSTSGRVTRSQTIKSNTKAKPDGKQSKIVQSFAPRNASFQAPQIKNLSVLPKLAPPTKKKDKIVYKFDPVLPDKLTQITNQTRLKAHLSNTVQPRITLTPCKDLENKSIEYHRSPVPKSESSSEEKLRSPKSPSECVTMSRGKDNARKEMKKKINEGLLDADTSDIDCVNRFRRQLHSEIRRMTEMCEIWEKVQEQTTLTESVQELVLSAVGQARLLMSQKLAQFGSLVERCARPDSSNALVTPADLAGFWDMVFMQVEDIDMRFKKLERLKSRGWVEDKPVEIKKKVTKINAKKPTKPTTGPSRLREMIAAARKAKMNTEEPTEPIAPGREGAVGLEIKTFEAGFFCVRTPVRSPVRSPLATPATPATPATTTRPTLLTHLAVLSNEANKSASKSLPFAMLRASVLSKSMDHDGISLLPQTPINMNATPGCAYLNLPALPKNKRPRNQ